MGVGDGKRPVLGILHKTGWATLTNDSGNSFCSQASVSPLVTSIPVFYGSNGSKDGRSQGHPRPVLWTPQFCPCLSPEGSCFISPCPVKGVRARTWISESHHDQALLYIHPPNSVQVELCFAYNQSAGNPNYRRNISECWGTG